MKKLFILSILLLCIPLVGQITAQEVDFKNSYFAVGLTVDNMTVADPIKVSFDGAWLTEFSNMKDVYIAPMGTFRFGDKTSPQGGVGAKIFYSDTNFGKFISIGSLTTFSKNSPQYDVITGMGFTAKWDFIGIHPGFMVNWIPTANGEDNEITLSLFGVF